ncbi:MAG TPA: type II toxin-antitoxin system RelE/ParE family toxin [Candidatus Hydrogenedentes bacterium]|nr:MAG: Toxin RelG [Candidatus Hydrogenedentes bacterium ADurb.Bin179]HOH29069.1 type II toxin-antitoxin system RelE/ParE family toxin [Candidatus Hydrogenedentota bacterium]
MACYKIQWKSSAAREVRKLPKDVIQRVIQRIEALVQNPFPSGARKMATVPGAFRLRVGDYRIIYRVYDKELVIEVIRVGHRRDIYDG